LSSPAVGRGDQSVGLPGPGLADDDAHTLAAAEQPLDHRPLIGLHRRPLGEDARDDDLGDHGGVLSGGHDLDPVKRSALKLPDGAGSEALALGAFTDADYLRRGEEGIGRLLDVRPARPCPKFVGNGLNYVLSVKVGLVGRNRSCNLIDGEGGAFGKSCAAHRGPDRAAV
jgi:hypothetical protein